MYASKLDPLTGTSRTCTAYGSKFLSCDNVTTININQRAGLQGLDLEA